MHPRFIVSKTLFFVSVCGLAVAQKPVHQDTPFWQDYSVKFYAQPKDGTPQSVFADRNGTLQIHTSTGLFQPADGQFLQHGKLQPDTRYRPLKDLKINALSTYQGQLVYLNDEAVLSNAWAGKLYTKHTLPKAKLLEGGKDFAFLVSDGQSLQLVQDQQIRWQGSIRDSVIQLRYQAKGDKFWILGKQSLHSLVKGQLTKEWEGSDLTAFDLTSDGQKLIIGTKNGYWNWDLNLKKPLGAIHQKLPWTDITAVRCIGAKTWFGSTKGAFALRPDGQFDYYNGERWLPSDDVVRIETGPENAVLVLTSSGLGKIYFKKMTLHQKAQFFEQQVRSRHLRHGFNASLEGMEKGNIASGYLADSDNDGLWTAMYLGGQAFRYAATKDPEALQNCRESLDAMERLYTVNPVPGFPARSFERHGYVAQLADPERWQHAPDPRWDWKATTSSDEAIGHIFAFGVLAELVPDLKKQAVMLIDTLMGHIVRNNWYLIDYNGKPTTWGRWHPDYVNGFPTNVGDRKLNSSNIIGMLQTAYHFTKKEVYRTKAFELMTRHGYLANLRRPMREIGMADPNADDHSKMLSDAWNHSDDEMYYMGYWGLYRYAFNDSLQKIYKATIIDHWQAERPEKEGLWNVFTALTGTPQFDLKEAVWYLQEHPLDLIDWNVANSHRRDIEKIGPNFRNQTTKEVLPPDERPIQRHNANMFALDRTRGNGISEHSAGDIWLLPYWMGRWLGVIGAAK
ncbi:MAG: hypothetical protein MUE30_01690 [Spirosomaceae bacterium]|jgi:hypothetical protein|nr:hypothetical protein [Spirosomataceae bacterium]